MTQIKLYLDDNYIFNITREANEILEQMRQDGLKSRFPSLVPGKPVHMSMAEVEAVLCTLYKAGEWEPPLNKSG